MKNYNELERLLTPLRLKRYLIAANGNKRKTIDIYFNSLLLSGTYFSFISLFEVIFRNKINQHFITQFATKTNFWLDWVAKNEFNRPDNKRAREEIKKAIQKAKKNLIVKNIQRNLTNDDVVANLTLGFWTSLLWTKQYLALNSTILNVFPNLPEDTRWLTQNKRNNEKRKLLKKQLYQIGCLRNRIAHQENICLTPHNTISFHTLDTTTNFIQQITTYMGENYHIYTKLAAAINQQKTHLRNIMNASGGDKH
jgi:hypothetical protein